MRISIERRSQAFWLICILLLAGCPSKPSPTPLRPAEPPFLERLSPAQLPDLHDDEPAASLRSAIEKSLSWYARIRGDRQVCLGRLSVPAELMRESLNHFASLVDSGGINAERLSQDFDVFRVVPPENSGRIIVTGYYEPVLEGSLKPGVEFCQPIYPVPSDLLVIELDRFGADKFHGERLVGRLEKNFVVPYYSRSEIDGEKVLEKHGVQPTVPLVWLRDPVDCFFLHVQGSAVIKLNPDGKQVRLGYAGANGRPYHSIGKDLIDSGEVPPEQMSMQAISAYLRSHPDSQNAIMWKNESYVFFKWVAQGPMGSLDVVLTAGRSIATDPRVHPSGAPAFLVSEKPVYDSSGKIQRWERFGRWVLNQDSGGAIKGAGRIDLFCGTGEAAEMIAGPMKQRGELYYFIKKGLICQEQQ